MGHLYFACDFETCNSKDWFGFYGVLYEWTPHTVRILRELEVYVNRPLEKFDQKRKKFWLVKNRQSYDYMMNSVTHTSVEKAEYDICKFVRSIMYNSSVRVVSDNPQFDLGYILDTMLERHGKRLSTIRHCGKWRHSICSFSYTYGVAVPALQGTSNHTPKSDVGKFMHRFFYVLNIRTLENKK